MQQFQESAKQLEKEKGTWPKHAKRNIENPLQQHVYGIKQHPKKQ